MSQTLPITKTQWNGVQRVDTELIVVELELLTKKDENLRIIAAQLSALTDSITNSFLTLSLYALL
jgi:hypothetical protein